MYVGTQRIQHADFVVAFHQFRQDMSADKARSSGQKDTHVNLRSENLIVFLETCHGSSLGMTPAQGPGEPNERGHDLPAGLDARDEVSGDFRRASTATAVVDGNFEAT